MPVIASLVLGADGSSSLRGNSAAISTPIDRERFLARRKLCDVIIVGGKTAKADGYTTTPVPLVIISHSRPGLLDVNPKVHWWMMPATEAIERAQKEFGPTICIEGGISMISELLEAGAISQLELSISPNTGGENKMDRAQLLKYFKKVKEELIVETIFYTCTEPIAKPR